ATAGLVALTAVAWIANWIARRVLVRGLQQVAARLSGGKDSVLLRHNVVDRLANAVPAVVVQAGIELVPHLSPGVVQITRLAAQTFIFLMLVLTASKILDVLNELYERRPDARSKP